MRKICVAVLLPCLLLTLSSCGASGDTTPAPSFVGLNSVPRQSSTAAVDDPIQADGTARDIVLVSCENHPVGLPNFQGQLVVQGGKSPLTYSQSGSTVTGLQLDASTGAITYAPNICIDQGKDLPVTYHVVDSQNQVSKPDFVVTYGVR